MAQRDSNGWHWRQRPRLQSTQIRRFADTMCVRSSNVRRPRRLAAAVAKGRSRWGSEPYREDHGTPYVAQALRVHAYLHMTGRGYVNTTDGGDAQPSFTRALTQEHARHHRSRPVCRKITHVRAPLSTTCIRSTSTWHGRDARRHTNASATRRDSLHTLTPSAQRGSLQHTTTLQD